LRLTWGKMRSDVQCDQKTIRSSGGRNGRWSNYGDGRL